MVIKRAAERHGHRTAAEKAAARDGVLTEEQVDFLADPVVAPAGNPRWHPVALAWYESLKLSGQSTFYEPSDWAFALILGETLSRELRPQVIGMSHDREGDAEPLMSEVPIRGASLTSIMRGMSLLLVSEGDRRRLKLEIERGEAHHELAVVSDLAASREEAIGSAS